MLAGEFVEHIERPVDRRQADSIAVAGENLANVDGGVTAARTGKMDQTHRPFRRPAPWPGDAGDRNHQLGPAPFKRAGGHGADDRLADRAVLGDQFGRYAEDFALGMVRVGDEPAFEDCRRAGDPGQAAGDQSASAGFGGDDPQTQFSAGLQNQFCFIIQFSRKN